MANKTEKNSKTNKNLKDFRFSKPVLLTFVVIFALIGGYAIYRSFADVISNPTHIVDEQWNFPNNGSGYNDVSVDITPKADGTPDGYFYANEFYFPNSSQNGNTGYIGLQSEGNNGVDNGYQTIPKMVDFQIWNITSGSPVSGGWGTSFGGEGVGYSVRIPYNWVVGHTYRMDVFLQSQTGGNNVWAGKVTDLSSGITTQVGLLNAPSSFGLLDPATITFHERFSGPTTNCVDITRSAVTFADLTANNGSVTATPSQTFSSGVDPAQCPGYVSNSLSGGVLSSSYGPAQSSKSPGDCNADGSVNLSDLSILLANYNSTSNLSCDFNQDNVINVFDLSILLSHYGANG